MRRIRSILSIITITTVVLVMGAAVSYATTTVNNATAYVNSATGVNLRSSASIPKNNSNSNIVTSLNDNTKLTVKRVIFKTKDKTAANKKWYEVSVNGTSGYIRADNVDGLKYSAVDAKATSKDGVVYRKGAGTKMKKVGTLKKGTKVKVLLKATPVKSTKGGSSLWYMIKYNGKKYYACSKYIKIIDSKPEDEPVIDPIDPVNPVEPVDPEPITPDPPKENRFEKMTDEEFEAYLVDQGFTGAYVTKLQALHKKHPNWVFKGLKTGLKWSDVVAEEHENGVSLIHSSFPISYRDTSAMSMETAKYKIYKKRSTSSDQLGTLASGAKFKLLNETWNGTNCWLHIKTDSDVVGFIKARAFSEDYLSIFSAVINDNDVNIRSGAGTENDAIGTKKKGTVIEIVLMAKDKNSDIWYKFKTDGGYAYVKSDYVDFDNENAADEILKLEVTAKAGTFKAKDGSSWFNADKSVVAYYLDPRNFLNEDRIYMFEDLNYDEEVHTETVVDKVLTKTLKDNGFTAKLFVNAGKKHNVNPVFLASRAVQETGGGSDCIYGSKVNGTTVYNPFNIGAYSGSNPVKNALNYAYDKGWTTKAKAVNGGAEFLAEGYISKKQNSIYLQKFNVANGKSGLEGHHQYMTNITAAYSESLIVKKSYVEYGIDEDALTFIIPIYESMPNSTKLP